MHYSYMIESDWKRRGGHMRQCRCRGGGGTRRRIGTEQ